MAINVQGQVSKLQWLAGLTAGTSIDVAESDNKFLRKVCA
jgi:hypothetical protein